MHLLAYDDEYSSLSANINKEMNLFRVRANSYVFNVYTHPPINSNLNLIKS